MDSISESLKRCTKCGEIKPRDQFNKCRGAVDGMQRYCRACQKATFAAHYAEKFPYHQQRRKDYDQSHAEQVAAYAKEYYAANREQHIAAVSIWVKNNPDKVRANKKRQYIKHRSVKIANAAAYAQQHPDRVLHYKNKWDRANRVKRREIKHRRRAREYTTRVGKVDYAAIWERDHGICHICQAPVNPADLHYDHIVPLAKGGAHIAENIAVSHARCNLRKGAKITK